MMLAGSATAIDGLLDASASWQEGRSGAQSYSSKNQILRGTAGQRISFSRDLWMYVRYGAQVETQENRTVASFTSYRKETQDPFLSVSYQTGDFEAGLNGNVRRTDYFWYGLASTRDDYASGTVFLKYDGDPIDLEGRLSEGRSHRYMVDRETETRDARLSFAARARLSDNSRLQYEFARSISEVYTSNYLAEFRTHRLAYNGHGRFASDRGTASITARYKQLEQIVEFGGEDGVTYLQPDWGGFVLDDTPEDLDPLEPDPVQVPALHDNDRDTPTIINIGDSAPVVREFGGDYRNIIFDFGDVVQMSSAVLYVDTILRFPELMRWHVYVSDDPEGRIWGEELGPAEVTWSYGQMANNRQGWTFEFTTPVAHRRVKVVNSKLGPTEPDIFINEFEVYGPSSENVPDYASGNKRLRLTGNVSFLLNPDLEASYRGDFWRTTYDEEDRDDRSFGHFLGLAWTPGAWQISGSLSANYRNATSGRNTEVYTQALSVIHRPRENIRWRTSWNRTNDLSYNRDQVTNDVAGEISWQALPALNLRQRVSYGRRDDFMLELQSSSWTLVTYLRSSPRQSIVLDIKRSDRWVSQEAGSGFTTFNDTDFRFSWAIMPRLVYSGLARYQVRETDSWMRRNILSLTPLPGGSMNMSFYASHTEDTRADTRQRSVGARATWRPRTRLMLEGGIEYSQFTQGATYSTPTSYRARGYWTF